MLPAPWARRPAASSWRAHLLPGGRRGAVEDARSHRTGSRAGGQLAGKRSGRCVPRARPDAERSGTPPSGRRSRSRASASPAFLARTRPPPSCGRSCNHDARRRAAASSARSRSVRRASRSASTAASCVCGKTSRDRSSTSRVATTTQSARFSSGTEEASRASAATNCSASALIDMRPKSMRCRSARSSSRSIGPSKPSRCSTGMLGIRGGVSQSSHSVVCTGAASGGPPCPLPPMAVSGSLTAVVRLQIERQRCPLRAQISERHPGRPVGRPELEPKRDVPSAGTARPPSRCDRAHAATTERHPSANATSRCSPARLARAEGSDLAPAAARADQTDSRGVGLQPRSPPRRGARTLNGEVAPASAHPSGSSRESRPADAADHAPGPLPRGDGRQESTG